MSKADWDFGEDTRLKDFVLLDLNEVTRNSLMLMGAGEIGMVANAQAGLNHSGLLDVNTMFVMSDVIDAVNYKTGDISPVLNGLLECYCKALKDGVDLGDSVAVNRVRPMLEKYWDQFHRGHFGPLKEYFHVRPVEWIDQAIEGLEEMIEDEKVRVHLRSMRANGPVDWLLRYIDDDILKVMQEYDHWRSVIWSDFIRYRDKMLEDASQESAWSVFEGLKIMSRKLNEDVNMSFVDNLISMMGNERFQPDAGYEPGTLIGAYQQWEAVRPNRWNANKEMNMKPLLAVLQADVPGLMAEMQVWADGNVIETLLIKANNPWNQGDNIWYNGKGVLMEPDGARQQRLNDPMSLELLDHAYWTGEEHWTFLGMVGGDSNVMVLTPRPD